ncbi:hypothetical protein N2152v2_004070 [Parachlorella kessleri]
MKRLTAAIILGYQLHCASALQKLPQLETVQQLRDFLKQLRDDGTLASIAAQLAADLDSGASEVEAAAAWDLAVLWRSHHLPALKTRAAANIDQLRTLLRQLRDDGTLARLAPGQSAAAVAVEAAGHERAAASALLAAPVAKAAPTLHARLGRESALVPNAESLAVGLRLPAFVPRQAAMAGPGAGTKRRRSKRPAAALGALLTAGVLAGEAASEGSEASDSEGVRDEGVGRVNRRKPPSQPATSAGSLLYASPQRQEQEQQGQQQQPEQEHAQAQEPQQDRQQEQQQEQQRQQRGQGQEPQRDTAGTARRHALPCSPSATSDDEVIIVSQTPGLACRRAASIPSPSRTAAAEGVAAGVRQCAQVVAVKQEGPGAAGMGPVGCSGLEGCAVAKVGVAHATLVAGAEGEGSVPGMPTGSLPAAYLPPPPPLPLPQQQQLPPHLPQQHQPVQNAESQPAADQNNIARQAQAPPPAEPAVAAAAEPSTCTLPTLLSRCCRSRQAAAVGLTARLVGAFAGAYSKHFTPLQKQEAAQWVGALLAEGQLEAVRSYLESMV